MVRETSLLVLRDKDETRILIWRVPRSVEIWGGGGRLLAGPGVKDREIAPKGHAGVRFDEKWVSVVKGTPHNALD